MTSYLDYYKARVSLGVTNRQDKLIKQAERTFENVLSASLRITPLMTAS